MPSQSQWELTGRQVDTFADPPDPAQVITLDDIVERLRLLQVWVGDPSYETIKDRINAAWSEAGRPTGELARKATVVYCFRYGRWRPHQPPAHRRAAVAGALGPIRLHHLTSP